MTGRQQTLVFLAVCCLMIVGFFSCFEKKEIEVPTPGTLEAAGNRYLGALRLLDAMGHEVVVLDGVHSLDSLPPTDATLLLTARRRELTERRSYAILGWVESGGHLVLRPQETFTEGDEIAWTDDDVEGTRDPDRLLDPFQLRAYSAPADEADEADWADEDEQGEAEVVADETGELAEEIADVVESWAPGPSDWHYVSGSIGDAEGLDMAFVPLHWGGEPTTAPLASVRGPDGLHLVSFAHGDGIVTAVTDEWFLTNAHFASHDHAHAIVELVRLRGRDGPVYVLLSEDFPGLWSQIATYAWPAAASLGLLVLAWLWRSAPRFGPVAADPLAERREWIEHLEAVGEFHWRLDRARQLIASTRAGVLRLIELRHPLLARMSPSERNMEIAEGCGLGRASVRRALDETEFPNAEASVARTIANLERIRSWL